jgi:hypothetical protein
MSLPLSSSTTLFISVVLRLLFFTLLILDIINAINRNINPRSLFPAITSPGSNATNRRTSKLKILPKANAITVELRIITLYGILKSGVGRLSKSDGVRNTPPPTIVITAGLD